MGQDVSIVMSLVDKVSAPLQGIIGKTKAFDKAMDELEAATRAYEKSQGAMRAEAGKLRAALEESSVKVQDARKEYRKLKDETSKGVLDKAIEEQEEYKNRLRETEEAMKANRKALAGYQDEARKLANGGGSAEASLGAKLAKAGIFKLVGDSAAQFGSAFLESAAGQPAASAIESVISGTVSGAAMGAIAGPAGIGIGALAGAASGLAGAGTAVFEAREDAFKSYYTGLRDEALSARQEEREGGSGLAGGRETSLISFSTLLGSREEAEDFLEEIRTLANTTPFLYDDLTALSKTLLAYGTAAEDILPLLTAVGDAGAALGMSTSDIAMVATALGRLQSTDKTTLEYLNLLTERGVGAIDWLAERDGVTTAEVYDRISKGAYSGKETAAFLAARFDEEFGGSMAEQSRTFEGLSSTLQGWEDEMNAALGSAYNERAGAGLLADIDAYGGGLGDALSQMNALIGEGQGISAALERQYGREALEALLQGKETTVYGEDQASRLRDMHEEYEGLLERYETASDEEKAEIGARAEALKSEAEALAQASFENSGVMASVHDAELELTQAIRENTAALEGAWSYSMARGSEDSKGIGSTLFSDRQRESRFSATSAAEYWNSVNGREPVTGEGVLAQLRAAGLPGYAYGLERVPYDNYPALLHQGERVLTAQQARRADSGSGGIQITIGSLAVREEADVDRVAQVLLDKLRLAGAVGE